MSGTQGIPTAGMDTQTLKGVRQLVSEMKKLDIMFHHSKKNI